MFGENVLDLMFRINCISFWWVLFFFCLVVVGFMVGFFDDVRGDVMVEI